MNKVSPIGFAMMQTALTNDVVIRLCALADPPKTGKFKNLSVDALLDRAYAELPRDRTAALRDLRQRFADAFTPIDLHRNKRVAHLDYETHCVLPLPPTTVDELTKAVDAMTALLQAVSLAIHGEHAVIFVATSPGNAVGELGWLVSDGVRFRELRELANRNDISDSDLRARVKLRADY